MSPTARAAVTGLRRGLLEVARPDDAPVMSAYMRGRFPFLGVKTPARRSISKPVIASMRHDIAAVRELVDELWRQPEREFHQMGVDAVAAVARQLGTDDLDWVCGLITTNSWWDTVDGLAPSVGKLVRHHRAAWVAVDGWADHTGTVDGADEGDMWCARVSLIHQLRDKADTDVDALYNRIQRRAADTDFFIRKAIGWALRTHAKTDPDIVRAFVDHHRNELSALSVREATKHL